VIAAPHWVKLDGSPASIASIAAACVDGCRFFERPADQVNCVEEERLGQRSAPSLPASPAMTLRERDDPERLRHKSVAGPISWIKCVRTLEADLRACQPLVLL